MPFVAPQHNYLIGLQAAAAAAAAAAHVHGISGVHKLGKLKSRVDTEIPMKFASVN